MADFGEYRDQLAQIRQEWNEAEEDIKLAEQVCQHVVFPSIKELRYAGRRLIEALNKIDANAPQSEIAELFSDAQFDCHRARHDAIDAATSKIAIDIDIAEKKLGYDAILKAFPRFSDLLKPLVEIKGEITKSRKNRDDRDAIYSVLEKNELPRIVDLYNQFKISEPIMKKLARRERIGRVICYGLAIVGITVGVIGILT